MRKNILLCLSLGLSLILTGCGSRQKIPALKEPVAENESYRPVGRENVSRREIYLGFICPEEYSHSVNMAGKIDKVYAGKGETVRRGELLIEIDHRELDGQLSRAKQELSQMQKKIRFQNQIYREERLQVDEGKHGETGGKNRKILEENHRYEMEAAAREIKDKKKFTAELERRRKRCFVRAKHDGTVRYAKEISVTVEFSAGETLAVVSDAGDLHMEINEPLSSDLYKKCQSGFFSQVMIRHHNKMKKVKLHKFSKKQMMKFQMAENFPDIQINLDKKDSFSEGEVVPVYFQTAKKSNVLAVGKDSLYQEGDEYFVYVKKQRAGRPYVQQRTARSASRPYVREKRKVEIGLETENYAEVISGLEEGEEVFFTSGTRLPDTYQPYSVSLSDFVLNDNGSEGGFYGGEGNPSTVLIDKDGKKAYYHQTRRYEQAEEAEVLKVYVREDSMVKKGDPICKLSVKTGGAAVMEKSIEIREQEKNLISMDREYNNEMAELGKQIKAAGKPERKILESKRRAAVAAYGLSRSEEMFSLGNLRREKQDMLLGRNERGEKTIRAAESGMIHDIDISEDTVINPEESSLLCMLTGRTKGG